MTKESELRMRTVARYRRMLARVRDTDALKQIADLVSARLGAVIRANEMQRGLDNLRLLKEVGHGMMVWHVGPEVTISNDPPPPTKAGTVNPLLGIARRQVWRFPKNISLRVGRVYPRKKLASLILNGGAPKIFTLKQISQLTLSDRPWDPLREQVLAARRKTLLEFEESADADLPITDRQ